MKIAITGHTAGIGQALAEAYYGHEIVGLSKRDGNNIRNVPKIADQIEPCDVFINNAQAGFAQTELLFEVHRRWEHTQKRIVVISTMMAQHPVSVMEGMDEYRLQKVTLENAVHQLRYKNPQGPGITLVRPGRVEDPELWARTLVGLFKMAEANGLTIPDISLT
jgi:NAD(P)-dependent dehydrogenase (short-subunit alcohol dehydrogenase family)